VLPLTGFLTALLIGLAASSSYVALATPNLGFHGAHYDEVQKAVPAFAWIDRPSHMFSRCRVLGIPVMIMKYKAATEGFIYGVLWLATGNPFTIESWRMFAIGAVALGILAFALLARHALKWWALALVLSLFVLDPTVALGGRLNWGPVALGLLEQMLLVGVFVYAAVRAPSSAWPAFVLGAIVGFATFDKLSRAGLVIPVGLWLLLDGGGNKAKRILAAIGGGMVGALPLIVINARWWLSYGELFSLAEIKGTHARTGEALTRVLSGCLTSGSGTCFSEEMLGHGPGRWVVLLEGAAMAAAIAATLFCALRAWRTNHLCRIAGLLALSWLALVGWLYALPETTFHHHWPLTIPFATLAAVLALQAVGADAASRSGLLRVGRAAVAFSLVALLAARIPATLSVQEGLREMRTTDKWHPGLNELGRFAASRPEGTRFIAASWGVATQIFCFSQGRREFIQEAYWKDRGPNDLASILAATPSRHTIYIVALDPPIGPHADEADNIFADSETLPNWREAPVEPELATIDCLRVKKLVRTE
jgi:hypothetical protein